MIAQNTSSTTLSARKPHGSTAAFRFGDVLLKPASSMETAPHVGRNLLLRCDENDRKRRVFANATYARVWISHFFFCSVGYSYRNLTECIYWLPEHFLTLLSRRCRLHFCTWPYKYVRAIHFVEPTYIVVLKCLEIKLKS